MKPLSRQSLKELLGVGVLVVLAVASVTYLAIRESLVPVTAWLAAAVFVVSVFLLIHLLPKRFAVAARSKIDLLLSSPATPYGIAAAGVLVAMGELVLGELPVSQDHAEHYLQTHIFVYDMLAEGRLFGWTERVSNGLPFGDVYATGTYVITAFSHVASFGLVSLETSYAWGIVMVWMIPTLAVVAWSRRLGAGVWAALAGLAFALDIGGPREGGWTYSMFHAVWPQVLATGMWLLSLLMLFRLAERPTRRRLAVAVLFTGAALWIHPMNAVNFAVAAPLMGLVFWVGTDRDARVGGIWIMVALAGGALLGLGWVSHLMAASEDLVKHLAYWRSLGQPGAAWLETGPFVNQVVLVSILALVGLVVATVGSTSRFAAFSLVAFATFIVIGSMDLLASTSLGLHESNPLFMYRRFSVSAKPIWFALAGVGAMAVSAGVRQLAAQSDTPEFPKWIVLAVLAPIALAVLGAFPDLVESPAARPLTSQKAGIEGDLAGLTDFLHEEAGRLGPDRPHRIAFWPDTQGDYTLFAVANSGFGYVPSRSSPAQAFTRFGHGRQLEVMDWLGASVLVSQKALKNHEKDQVAQFGRFHVYRRQSGPTYPARVDSAEVRVLDWTDEFRRFEISGAEDTTRLELGWPRYFKWSAWQDGSRLEVKGDRSGGWHTTIVKNARNGIVELRYENTTTETLFGWLALMVALGSFFLLASGRSLQGFGSSGVLPGLTSLAGVAIMVSPVVVIVLAFHLGDKAVHERWTPKPGQEVLEELHLREPTQVAVKPGPLCVRAFDRDPRVGCNERDYLPFLWIGPRRSNQIPSCLNFGVPRRGGLQLGYDLPPGTDLVLGRVHRLEGNFGGRIEVAKESTPLQTNGLSFSIEADGLTLKLDFEGTGSDARGCIELVALSQN